MSRFRVDFPFGGQNDDRSYTDQPTGTTSSAENVRGYSPTTGRRQGGQRNGLSKYLGGDNDPLSGTEENVDHVQALSPVSYQQATDSYAALGTIQADIAGNPDSQPTDVWAKVLPLKDSGLDVQLDVQRNAFVLSSSATVVKYNADGEEVYTFQVPLLPGESAGKRLALDGDSGIYVGLGGPNGVRIFRYLETEDGDGVEVQWIHTTNGTSITDLRIHAGTLYAAVNHSDPDQASRVVQLDALLGSTPIEVLSRDVPSPVNHIGFSRGGLVFSCPPNQGRGPKPVGGGVLASTVDWHPWELTNAHQRLHCWLSAWGLGGFAAGQAATPLPDIRSSERTAYTTAGGSPSALVDESVSRDFLAPTFGRWYEGDFYGASPPRYFTSVLGPYPGVGFDSSENFTWLESGTQWRYDNGNGLTSGPIAGGVDYRADKVSASAGTLPGSTGLMPNTFAHNYAITMLVRVPHSNPQVLWLKGLFSGVLHSAPNVGWLALTVNDDGTGSYHGTDSSLNTVPGAEPGGVSLYAANSAGILGERLHGTASAVSGDEINTYLISLVVETGSATGDTIRLRVQGADVATPASGTTSFDGTLISPGREVLGHRVLDPHTQFDLATVDRALEGIRSFDGEILECISYFADSTADTSPHDDNVAHSNAWVTSHADSEVQKVEGYVAHKWGVAAQVLNGSHQYASTAPSGTTSSVYDAIVPGAVSAAMVSPDGILGKLDFTTGSVLWAMSGSGIGYGQVIDPENDAIFTSGPHLAVDTSEQLAPMSIIHRKVTDNGLSLDADIPSTTTFTLTALPSEGDYVRIGDGTDTTNFTFTATATSDTEISISGPANPATLANNIISILSSAGYAGAYADVHALLKDRRTASEVVAYPFTMEIWNRLAANLTISYNVVGTVTTPDAGGVTLTDSAATFVTDGVAVGDTVTNDTDGSTATVTSVTSETVLVCDGLSGGTDDQWDSSDDYTVTVASRVGAVVNASTATDGWTVNSTEPYSPDEVIVRMGVDYEGDVYIPKTNKSGGVKQNHVVKRAKADGAEVFTFNAGGVETASDVNAVALSGLEQDWGGSITSPEFIWLASTNNNGAIDPTIETVRKTRLVERTPLNVEPNVTVYRAIAGGNLYDIPRGGSATLIQSGVTDEDSVWTDTAVAFGKLYIVDNGTYWVHDPKKYALDAASDHTIEWKSKTGGEIPKGCKLIESYRGRLLLAGGDDPYALHASAIGDPDNWDFFPREGDNESRAWSGTSIAAVRNPDQIKAIVPWYDNAVLIGGDRTITLLAGDPTTGGGFNLITDATGMAWGTSWAIASDGSVYFVGSRGGVWRMVPPTDGRITPPVELTERTVNRELTDIDFSATKVRCVWHEDEDALQVILARNTASSTSIETEHWWLETRTGAWWKDKFAASGVVPQSVKVFDGDEPDDRIVVYGCEDGRVRYWDRSALADDTEPVYSHVLIGPLVHPEAAELEQRLQGMEATLADSYGECTWELYASDDPELPGDPVATGQLSAGFMGRIRTRARGGYLWIKLLNRVEGKSWALESLFVDIAASGRRRSRR